MTASEDWRPLFAHPVFERLFRHVRMRYERLERVGGTVRLVLRDDGERAALSGFLGRDLRGADTVHVSLAQLDGILRNSRIGLGLPAFLERYFEEPLRLRSEMEREAHERWAALFAAAEKTLAHETPRMAGHRRARVAAWLHGLREGTAPGSQLLRRLYHEDAQEALNTLQRAVQALARLPGEPGLPGAAQRIPVFAAELTGDPHALDADKPLTRLFEAGLKDILAQDGPPNTGEPTDGWGQMPLEETTVPFGPKVLSGSSFTEGIDGDGENWETISASLARRRLFRQAGLLDDDVSSTVATFGLFASQVNLVPYGRNVETTAGQICHPGVRAADFLVILTLRHLEESRQWDCRRPLYVVENPSVFSALMDTWEIKRIWPPPQLALLSGQPSAAAIRLLEQWEEQGGKFFYHGDFDWKGLEIACRLQRLFPRAFHPWRLDSRTYHQYKDVPKWPLPPAHQQAVRSLTISWDPGLPGGVAAGGSLYQEQMVAELIRDVFPESRTCK